MTIFIPLYFPWFTRSPPRMRGCRARPGAGPLVGEPTLRRGRPLVRLSDLSAPTRRLYDRLVTFAQDPYALYRMTTMKWDGWFQFFHVELHLIAGISLNVIKYNRE